MSATTLNYAPPSGRMFSSYLDLAGGLNTKKDAHALNRNQLASSVNCWYGTGNALSTRPGTAAIVTASGSTGSGVAGTGLVTARFNNKTYVVVQQGRTLYAAALSDTAWANIGTMGVGAGPIHAAQMFDPTTGKDTLFIVNGVDTPWMWQGPGTTITAVGTAAGQLPKNFSGTAPITPKYVTTLGSNSHLVYAGEPSFPTGVYISDPQYPELFSTPATSFSAYPGAYYPVVVGLNDGVNGGSITGIEPLAGSLLVYKEAAIYNLFQVGLLGDMVWAQQIVSASVGATSPRSVVRFDSFHLVLGIDGVYTVSPASGTRRISDNVPTYFDGSLNGTAAIITDRTTAVAVRDGQRYIIFFDDSSAGYPTRGLWFDFSKPDEDGLPTAGEIQGYKVGGAAALRAPQDDGNFVWTDASADRTGKFGLGFSDFGNPIQRSFYGKADMLADLLGDAAPMTYKQVQRVWLLVSVPQIAQGESMTFLATCVTDALNATTGSGAPIVITAPGSGQWGNTWGQFVWSGSSSTQYQTVEIEAQRTAQGRIVQFGFQESSIYQWTILGYVVEFNTDGVQA